MVEAVPADIARSVDDTFKRLKQTLGPVRFEWVLDTLEELLLGMARTGKPDGTPIMPPPTPAHLSLSAAAALAAAAAGRSSAAGAIGATAGRATRTELTTLLEAWYGPTVVLVMLLTE